MKKQSLFFFLSLVFFPFPFLLTSLIYNERGKSLTTLQEKISFQEKRVFLFQKNLDREKDFLNKLANKEKKSLEEHFMQNPFLLKEQALLSSAKNSTQQKRYAFLTSGANKLCFDDSAWQAEGLVEKREKKQKHPVELDAQDLQELFLFLESSCYTIKNFELGKQQSTNGVENYIIRMDIIETRPIKGVKI